MKSANSLFRHAWLGVTIMLFALTLVYHNEMSAAPVNQTVPGPTATNMNTPVPTATAVPDNNNNNNNDDNRPNPTPTPLPQPTATPEGLTAVVSTVRLNVRQGPGTDFAVLGVVVNGQTLRVNSRNETAEWWQICCVPGTNTSGWVSAQFLQPNFDLGQAQELVPLADLLPIPPAQPAEIAGSDSFTETTYLQLQIRQDPLYAWQGQTIDLVYDIANLADVAAVNLQLRNELPIELTFVEFVDVAGGSVMTETTEFEDTAFAITWPELAADEIASVRVRVQVTEELADGAVINNLAVVVADERSAITAGISIGMPPTTLPDFR